MYRDSARFGRYLRLFERIGSPAVRCAIVPGRRQDRLGAPAERQRPSSRRSAPCRHVGYSRWLRLPRRDGDLGQHPRADGAGAEAPCPVNSPARRFSPIRRGFTLVGFGRLREAGPWWIRWPRSLPELPSACWAGPSRSVSSRGHSAGGTARLPHPAGRGAGRRIRRRRPTWRRSGRCGRAGPTERSGERPPRAWSCRPRTPDSARDRGLLEATSGWARMVKGDTAAGIAALRSGLDQGRGSQHGRRPPRSSASSSRWPSRRTPTPGRRGSVACDTASTTRRCTWSRSHLSRWAGPTRPPASATPRRSRTAGSSGSGTRPIRRSRAGWPRLGRRSSDSPPSPAEPVDTRELGRSLIDGFGEGWSRGDVDRLMSVFRDDAVFIETPFSDPLSGPRRFAATGSRCRCTSRRSPFLRARSSPRDPGSAPSSSACSSGSGPVSGWTPAARSSARPTGKRSPRCGCTGTAGTEGGDQLP